MTNEYVIWGIAPNTTEEDILFTNAKTLQEAKKVVDILTTEHNCKNCRIQIIDFTSGIDFIKTIN
jgi:hypothetical protein